MQLVQYNNYLVNSHLGGCWWPDHLAPGHKLPQCCLHTYAFRAVYGLNIFIWNEYIYIDILYESKGEYCQSLACFWKYILSFSSFSYIYMMITVLQSYTDKVTDYCQWYNIHQLKSEKEKNPANIKSIDVLQIYGLAHELFSITYPGSLQILNWHSNCSCQCEVLHFISFP